MSDPIVIVGAGLAGACAAVALAADRDVLLVDREGPAAGASGAAAGLVNPFMARKARQVWRAPEAYEALRSLLHRIGRRGLFDNSGVLRPARDAKQADFFRQTADAFPREARWNDPNAVHAAFPDVHAPHGGLHIRHGGRLNVDAFVEALIDAFRDAGGETRFGVELTDWAERGETVEATFSNGQTMRTRLLLLALGYGYTAFPALRSLNLHAVKGETVQVRRPEGLVVPNLAGAGYVVPEGDVVTLGSTYDHRFSDLAPTEAGRRRILANAARAVPRLADPDVVAHRAGVRVTVPGTRLPVVGPISPGERVWIFSGLGSKGLLMAPLLATALPAYLADPGTIPPEVHPG